MHITRGNRPLTLLLLAAGLALGGCSNDDNNGGTSSSSGGSGSSSSGSSSSGGSSSGSSSSGSSSSSSGGTAACTAPITTGAAVSTASTATCLACSVTTPANVISGDPAKFAQMNLDLSLLTGADALRVTGPAGASYPAGQIAGFTLVSPPAALLKAGVLPQITIATYLGNGATPQDSAVYQSLLNLNLLGLLGNNNKFFLGVQTTKAFDAVQITVAPLLAGALDTLDIYQGCSDASGVGVLAPLPTPVPPS